MTIGSIILWIAVATVIILLLIVKLKINPTIALAIGAIVVGVACRLGLVTTASTIGTGFGNLMTSLGLPVGFGVILGELLSQSGACRVIASTIIRHAGPKAVPYAMALTGFILSVPVFFDVAFIILVPLCIEFSRELKKPLPTTVVPTVAGTMAAHFLVPPTPVPLLIPDYFPSISMGKVILLGIVIGVPVVAAVMKIYDLLIQHGWWTAACVREEKVSTEESEMPANAPSFAASLFPILLPVVLLVMSTVSSAMGVNNEVIGFLSNKNVAMMLGALAAYLVARKNMTGAQMEAAANKAMADAGVVLLVTGAGGSFAAVISATGLSGMLAEAMATSGAVSNLAILAVAYAISFVFIVSLGSGTTASITSMTIMSGVLEATSATINPYCVVLACIAGTMSLHHFNDSGFWVVTNMSGFTPQGGLKTYSTALCIMSILLFTLAVVGSFIF
ncbi:GntP family permease [Dysosmobacter sp.]|uniref:GntP family permease n=1 Tax=Dysosmobacter sp. TaxID=2591382 RepID=UPI002A876CDE|nr:GntP family permease [Dysosmobacter sp.]MDY3281586.1 GntP family permease [Dysosmobacter sp.]